MVCIARPSPLRRMRQTQCWTCNVLVESRSLCSPTQRRGSTWLKSSEVFGLPGRGNPGPEVCGLRHTTGTYLAKRSHRKAAKNKSQSKNYSYELSFLHSGRAMQKLVARRNRFASHIEITLRRSHFGAAI